MRHLSQPRPGRVGLLSLILLFSLCTGALAAASLQGRVSSTSFVYETYDEEPQRELDLINRLAFDARELGHESVSLHFMGTLRGEMLGDDSEDPETRIFHGYLKIAPSPHLKLALGRQWIYAGVGSSLLDGARIDLKNPRLGALTIYSGSTRLADENGDTFPNFDNFGETMGAHYRYAALPMRGAVGLSAARMMEDDQLVEQRIGASLTLSEFPLGKLDYELRYETESEKLYFSHLRLARKHGALDFGLTWNLKDGYLPYYRDSWIVRMVRDEEWFADGAMNRRHELRAQADIPCFLAPDFRWSAAVVEIFPEVGERGDGLELSLAGKGLRAGFRMQRGYRGERTGFFGSARKSFWKGTWIWLDLNRMAYKYGDESISEQAVRDDYSMASRVGVDHVSSRFPVELRLIFESLTTPRAKFENRFIGMIAYNFRTSNGEED